jgi:intracellular septation protein
MRDFLRAVRLLLLDLASTVVFLILFLVTHNTILSVSLGMALGLTQIGIQFVRRKPIDTMEWLSLFLIIAAGTATLVTDDPRFVLFKPSVIYVIVGVVMLKPGWMNRYLPAIARCRSMMAVSKVNRRRPSIPLGKARRLPQSATRAL